MSRVAFISEDTFADSGAASSGPVTIGAFALKRRASRLLPYLPPAANGLSLTQTLKKPDGLPTGFLTTRRVEAVAGADAPGQTSPSSDAADAAA